jgi:hypothetical protein
MCNLYDANHNYFTHVQLEYVQLNRLERGEVSAYREKCGESPTGRRIAGRRMAQHI